MTRVLVIGASQIGRALTVPLGDRGHKIFLLPARIDPDEKIISQRLSTLAIPAHRAMSMVTYSEACELASSLDLTVIAVNSLGFEGAMKLILSLPAEGTPVLILTKGLRASSGGISSFAEILGRSLKNARRASTPILALGGPYVAMEVAKRRRTRVVVAGEKANSERVIGLLNTEYLSLTHAPDLRSSCMAGALKNLYAVVTGIAVGQEVPRGARAPLSRAKNLSAAVFTQSIQEMKLVLETFSADSRVLFSLSGVGDFFVTCGIGRNHEAGLLLGRGVSVAEAEVGYLRHQTIEGLNLCRELAPIIERCMREGLLEPRRIPLLRFAIETIRVGRAGQIPWRELG